MQLGRYEIGQQVPIIWQITVPEGSDITSEPMLRVSYRDAVNRDTAILTFTAMEHAGSNRYVYLFNIPYNAKAVEYTVSYTASINDIPLVKEDDNFSVIDPVIYPSEVRESWCFGLPLSKSDGNVIPDKDIKMYIDNAIQEVQRKVGVFVRKQKIRCNATARNLIPYIDYDIEEPPYDYNWQQFKQYGFLQLRQYPIISVESIKLVLPNGQVIQDLTPWIKVYPKVGQLHVVAYAGNTSLMMGMGYPMMSGSFGRNMPQAIEVDYTAGFEKLPQDLHDIVAKIAAVDVLGIASDAVLAGIASLSTSIDGMSQSYTTSSSAEFSTYGSHIAQYQQEINAFFGVHKAGEGNKAIAPGGARTYYKGFTMKIL